MGKTKPEPKKGDPCPQCGGQMVEQRAATPEEYAKNLDRENPSALPPGVDTIDPAKLKEAGPLAKCASCGYKTRYRPEAGRDDRPSPSRHSSGSRRDEDGDRSGRDRDDSAA